MHQRTTTTSSRRSGRAAGQRRTARAAGLGRWPAFLDGARAARAAALVRRIRLALSTTQLDERDDVGAATRAAGYGV